MLQATRLSQETNCQSLAHGDFGTVSERRTVSTSFAGRTDCFPFVTQQSVLPMYSVPKMGSSASGNMKAFCKGFNATTKRVSTKVHRIIQA